MLKKKKVREEFKEGRAAVFLFLIFAPERPFLIKPVGKPNSLPRFNC